ncbi:MAG: DUF3592 domain-containing protein [Pirellulales bacterium]
MREFLSTAGGIIALVFTILGIVFSTTGLALAIFVRPQDIGITFLGTGGGFLAVGALLTGFRLAALRRRARLLETGLDSRGTIVELVQNPFVRLNGRHPWVVRYRYTVQGCDHAGSESMMDLPAGYTKGASVVVVYDPTRVELSALKRESLAAR